MDCFTLDIKMFKITEHLRIPLLFKQLDKSEIDDFETFADWTPSWENSFKAIKRIPDDVFIIEAEYSINKVGLIVYYPTLKWIMAFLVDPQIPKDGCGFCSVRKDAKTNKWKS